MKHRVFNNDRSVANLFCTTFTTKCCYFTEWWMQIESNPRLTDSHIQHRSGGDL